MTDLELKTLKDSLWQAADMLRSGAHLAANKYGQPILGLIFLRYADILYKQNKEEIDKEYNGVCGEIVEVLKDKIIVKVKDGAIAIKELQVSGKKRMFVKDYLNGNKNLKGKVFHE